MLDGSYDAVLHFAASSQVGESVADPEKYWRNNVAGTLELLAAMRAAGVRTLVFSSTAATYGEPATVPITEDAPTAPTNPYGATKLAVDHMITGECAAHGLAAVSLRYFNVAGAHGRHGERHDPESHLIPLVLQVAAGPPRARSPSTATTTRRPTAPACATTSTSPTSPRPTCSPSTTRPPGEHLICNLGNGSGFSVREVIEAARRVTGHPIPATAQPRRAGDPAVLVASADRARQRLGWQPTPHRPRGDRPRRLGLRRSRSDSSPTPQDGRSTDDRRPRSRPRSRTSSGARAGRDLGRARPGQPHRRAHRLQRRLRHAVRPAAHHRRRRRPPRRRAAAPALRRHGRRRRRTARRRPRARAPRRAGRAYPAAVLWTLREAGHRIGGADIHYDSTVPIGAGLSSSAALEVVTALALNDLHGSTCRARNSHVLCQRAENAYVGAPVGIMDQTASACCTEGHALHLDIRDLAQRQVPLDLAADGLRLLVVDTRVKHAHGDGAYGELRAGCEAAAAALGLAGLRDVAYDRTRTPRSRPARRAAAPPDPARRHREPPGGGGRRPARGRADPRDRPRAHRRTRLAARRLPDLLRRTRPGRRHRRSPTAPSGPG